MLRIEPHFMLLDFSAADAEAVIQALAGRLHDRGAVADSYGSETIAREQRHPTGLPTRPFAIAFPHAEAAGVHESSLAVATLHKPVEFHNMGDPDETLAVEIVFLLANKAPEEQVQALRQLALIFSEPDRLVHLRQIQTEEEAVSWFVDQLGQVGD